MSCVGRKECAQRAAVLPANGANDLPVFTHVDFQLGLKNARCGILEFVEKNQESPDMPMRRQRELEEQRIAYRTMHSQMKLFIDGCNAEKRLGTDLFDVTGLDRFKILNDTGIIKPAKLGHHGFNELIGENDLADFDEVEIPYEGTATVRQAVDEPLGDKPAYRFARRCATELEMIDEQRLVELAAGLETEVDDLGPDEIDRSFGLRGGALGFQGGP